jgi:hypothetical protein
MGDTITAEELIKQMNDAAGLLPRNPFNTPDPLNGLGRLFGVPVFEPPPPPQKVKLSGSVQVTSKFRKDFDIWLAGFFGYQDSLLERGQAIVSNYGIHIRKDDLANLMQITGA